MRRAHAKHARARTEENNRRPTQERAGSARARSARSAVPTEPGEAKLRPGKQRVPPPADGAGLVASLGGELLEVLRYFFVHFSVFQVGPWLLGLSTRPPSDVL
jgi:hypothetical protein